MRPQNIIGTFAEQIGRFIEWICRLREKALPLHRHYKTNRVFLNALVFSYIEFG